MTGTLYWITGLSGSGKTSISKIIYNNFRKKKDNIVFLDGDSMRRILNLETTGFDVITRKKNAYIYVQLAQLLTNQGIDVIFATIAMFNEIRDWNRKNIFNYIEIYIKSNIETLVKRDNKGIYGKIKEKKIKNVVGIDIELEEPQNPDMTILNDGSFSINDLANNIIKKIETIEKKNYNEN